MVRNDKSELGKGGHEQKYDKGIGECYEKSRNSVVYQRAFLIAADMYLPGGIRAETVYAERHKHQASHYLKHKAVLVIIHQIHDEAHAKPRYQGIDKVAHRGSDTCDKTVPPAFIQRALNTKHPNRAHRRGSHNAYKYSLENVIKYV